MVVSMDVGVQAGTEAEAGSVLDEDSGPGIVQTGTTTEDSGELESVVGPERDVEERDEGDESEEEDDGSEEIDVALGYAVSGRDG